MKKITHFIDNFKTFLPRSRPPKTHSSAGVNLLRESVQTLSAPAFYALG